MDAKRAKRKIWINSLECVGDMIKIDRRYLAYILDEVENDSFNLGYHDGYEDSCGVHNEDSDRHKGFEGKMKEW